MRLVVLILCLLCSVCYPQKSNDGWIRIYYVFNDEGKEIARRYDREAKWEISDPAIALEKMYQEKIKADQKYNLAREILKQINPNGLPKYPKKFNESVAAYNEYLNQK